MRFVNPVDSLKVNLGSNSPKLRLTLVTYLLETGNKPGKTISVEDFLALLDGLTVFVGAEMNDFEAMMNGMEFEEGDDLPSPSQPRRGSLDYL